MAYQVVSCDNHIDLTFCPLIFGRTRHPPNGNFWCPALKSWTMACIGLSTAKM